MTASEVAAVVSELKPRFLEGLAPPEIKAVLAAAKLRRYLANSVVTNQGHPAEHLFLLLKGTRAAFLHHTRWPKNSSALDPARRHLRRSRILVQARSVSRQHRNGDE